MRLGNVNDTFNWVVGIKAVSSTITFVAGLTTFLATEISTQNVWFGVVATALATIVVGVATSYPKWVKARGEDWAAIVKELRSFHLAQALEFKLTVAKQNRERTLMRSTKHALIGELDAARYYVFELQMILNKNQIEFPPYERKNMGDVYRKEDEGMEEMTEEALAIITKEVEEIENA